MTEIAENEILDLKGIPCPQNTAKALMKLSGMMQGEILKVIVDDGEPSENVPASLKEEDNFEIVTMHQDADTSWHIYIKVLY